MITIDDCIGLSDLREDEILALAEHEHIPEIAATALGAYLLHEKHGPERIKAMIEEDIRSAVASGDQMHAAELFMALRHFLYDHRDGLAGGE